ncbi:MULTISPECIES: LysR substrate-binding domain-containing protein [Ochrobactrum]|uniref:LysR substrate-binding domain-containing protein n=1 Tax=Ochrobactrum chromiisoli TaxID=2993941 RepID=A0ABT3QRX1_9HYPH|nr:LysR substrate-binding domain-containing protein [Ochrobactrum chromiisoli]MCX2698325.1 LysR substrate-binding domain-containing protein [Ochrobactrum chromiisoli]
MRRFLPSLSALHAFDASVRYLSFTRASENLGMTQSGVSRQIQNLELFLGLKLFERAGPRLVLTEEGQSYYEEVSRILAKLEEVSMDAVRGYKTQSLLKIGLPPTLMRKWAPGIISAIAKTHPQIWFEVFPCTHDLDWSKSDLDLALLRGIGNWVNVRSHLLFPEELVVVGSPDIVPENGLAGDVELLDFPLIQNSNRPSLWLHWLRGAGIHYNKRIFGPRLPTHDIIIECAVAGMGLAIAPRIFVQDELRSGKLKLALDRVQTSGESYFLCVAQARQGSKNVHLFRDGFIAEAKRHRHSLAAASQIQA